MNYKILLPLFRPQWLIVVFKKIPLLSQYLKIYKVYSCQILQDISISLRSICLLNLTAIHFVDFEKSREKGNFLKTTFGHLGLNRGSIFSTFGFSKNENKKSGSVSGSELTQASHISKIFSKMDMVARNLSLVFAEM